MFDLSWHKLATCRSFSMKWPNASDLVFLYKHLTLLNCFDVVTSPFLATTIHSPCTVADEYSCFAVNKNLMLSS